MKEKPDKKKNIYREWDWETFLHENLEQDFDTPEEEPVPLEAWEERVLDMADYANDPDNFPEEDEEE